MEEFALEAINKKFTAQIYLLARTLVLHLLVKSMDSGRNGVIGPHVQCLVVKDLGLENENVMILRLKIMD